MAWISSQSSQKIRTGRILTFSAFVLYKVISRIGIFNFHLIESFLVDAIHRNRFAHSSDPLLPRVKGSTTDLKILEEKLTFSDILQ